ncbi:APC family permease [Microlunatus sp. Gsoil 973]|uniref:APC family permease n=1 Tax=Microlunatus sp. Gsoil 973 TaxID=2672569 RepID=UPI001E378371|nr:APC family permease [Microlunatus sp. Gsoil 973]
MTSEAPTTLRRSLGLRDLIVYGLLFIGPTAPMGTFGVLDARSHGATALVFVIATIAMAFTAWSYARMALAVPRAGSVFAYAQAGLGRFPAFLAGWMLGLDYLFIPALAALFTGIAANSLVPGVPVWIFTVAGVLLITGLNIAGVKVAAAVGMVMLAIEMLLLVIFVVGAIIVLAREGPARPVLSPLVGFNGFDLAGALGAVSVAVLAFLGFDAIASFAEENTGSPRQVGRALLFCLSLAGLLFVVQTYFAGLLIRTTPETLTAHPDQQGTAFYDMLRQAIGGWFGQIVTAVRTIGPIFSALVAQAAVSRLMYGMARDGRLPAVLGRLGQRSHTPRNAILLSAVVTVVIALLAALRDDGLDVLSSLVTVGALVAFVFLHASVVGYYVIGKRTPEPVRHVVLPAIGVLIVVIALVLASRPR